MELEHRCITIPAYQGRCHALLKPVQATRGYADLLHLCFVSGTVNLQFRYKAAQCFDADMFTSDTYITRHAHHILDDRPLLAGACKARVSDT